MTLKINRILIPLLAIILISLGRNHSSSAESQPSTIYLPIIDRSATGWIGPYGGYIVNIVVDPVDAQTIYAGTWGSGVYKSVDSGQSWRSQSFGLDNLYINSLAIDPHQHLILYAGTYNNQVYKSVNGGVSWAWSGTGMQEQSKVYTIAIDPQNTNTLYAGTRGASNNCNPPWKGVVYKSTDAGSSWTPALSDVGGPGLQDWVYSLFVDSNAANNIYAAIHQSGPYKSSNSGGSWVQIPNGINQSTGFDGRAIAISPNYSNGTTLFYGVWRNDTVYKSTNGGGNWFLSNNGIPYTKVYSLAIDPINSNTVFLATFTHGLVKSVDGGQSWPSFSLEPDAVYSIAVNPAMTDHLYSGTYGDGLFTSSDGGASWQPRNTGLNNAMLTSVIPSPFDPNKLYASVYGAGVYESDDSGSTWSLYNNGLGDKFVHELVTDPTHPGLLYALTNSSGLYKNDPSSSNSWVSVGSGLPLTQVQTPIFPTDYPFATREMQESSNAPQEIIPAGLASTDNLMNMVFAPSNPQIAYMGTNSSGVYKSTNGANSWQPTALGSESMLSLAVDPQDPNLVYAISVEPTCAYRGDLWKSINGGSSWTTITSLNFYSLATSTLQPGVLYAGTNTGIYKYQYGDWTPVGPSNQTVTSILVDPGQSNWIYAGTTDGAYYTKDGGLSWIKADNALDRITIQSISLNSNGSNAIFYSTTTHGIFLDSRNDYP